MRSDAGMAIRELDNLRYAHVSAPSEVNILPWNGDTFIRKGLSFDDTPRNDSARRKTRSPTTMPHRPDKPRLSRASCPQHSALRQHQAQPLHQGIPSRQPRIQRQIIARGRTEAVTTYQPSSTPQSSSLGNNQHQTRD